MHAFGPRWILATFNMLFPFHPAFGYVSPACVPIKMVLGWGSQSLSENSFHVQKTSRQRRRPIQRVYVCWCLFLYICFRFIICFHLFDLVCCFFLSQPECQLIAFQNWSCPLSRLQAVIRAAAASPSQPLVVYTSSMVSAPCLPPSFRGSFG